MSLKPFRRKVILSLSLLLIFAFSCSVFSPGEAPTTGPTSATITQEPKDPAPDGTPVAATDEPDPVEPLPGPSAGLPVFAVYREPAVEVVPAVQQESVAPDLSNVQISQVLSAAILERLAQDGFVVSLGWEKEFFTLYEKARYSNEPIFVTSDSLLHTYHLLFDKVLRTAEVEFFIPLLKELNRAVLFQTDAQYKELVGTGWEADARRTVAFVGVASRLLDPEADVPGYSLDLVEAELALIEAAETFLPSPIFPGLPQGEDYTQYIPRGHYTRNEALQAYFKSMMWYGRMTFRLKTNDPDVGKSETRSALLLVHALRHASVNGQTALEAWEALYSPTVFFVGRSDDLTVVQYMEVIDQIYGPNPDLATLADEGLLEAFIAEAFRLPPPQILGIVIEDWEEIEETTKGLRFMGQRFVPDAFVFRQLIYRNVGTRANPRGLPKGLDLLAAMGSERAYQLLEEMGDTRFENYIPQMEKVRQWMAGLTVEEWTETLYNGWLYSFYPLLEPAGEGYPAFMQNPAWLDKQINTCLGSWAELKHDTILYAKQVYAELGGGPPPPPPLPPRGYVEPVPHFYARLQALTAMTREGLAARGLLNELDAASLSHLEELAGALQTMAEKELRGEPLSEEEYERIRYYGGEIEQLTMAAADTDNADPFAPRYMDEEPEAAVIADVATNPALAEVLEEGVGRIQNLFVIVPIDMPDGTSYLQVARGGTFSYYEFPWPMNDRLTDEKWRQMLADDQAPPLPAWIQTFYTPESEVADLGRAVHEFQNEVTRGFWNPPLAQEIAYGAMQFFQSELEALVAARAYIAHQLVRSQVRSFDLQTPTLAVVTVREFWQDTRYEYQGDFPEYGEPPTATREPYSLDVTYTLEWIETDYDQRWNVTRVVYANEPPAWD